MTEYQDELLADAARVVATDLYPVRCRTLIANLAAEVEALRKRLDEAREAIQGLLDCPDIADSDYKDEATHEAERVARDIIARIDAKPEACHEH